MLQKRRLSQFMVAICEVWLFPTLATISFLPYFRQLVFKFQAICLLYLLYLVNSG